MRALILVLSAAVTCLAVLILLYESPTPSTGPVFRANRLISDALDGEEAIYGDGDGNVLEFRVEKTTAAGPDRPPSFRLRETLKDRTGAQIGSAAYDHFPTVHFLFPLTAPQDPHGFDRIWVWQRIRREKIDWRNAKKEVWRFDCVDPALPPDRDTVVAWMDDSVPVFGLVRWQRDGRTWTLRSSRGGKGT